MPVKVTSQCYSNGYVIANVLRIHRLVTSLAVLLQALFWNSFTPQYYKFPSIETNIVQIKSGKF